MDGIFKLIIYTIFFSSLVTCKVNTKNDNSVNFVKSNMQFFLDSIDTFDWTQIPTQEEYDSLEKKFNVEIVDTIFYDTSFKEIFRYKLNKSNLDYIFYTFKIDNSFIQQKELKSIRLVSESTKDIYTLTVYFSNLFITKSNRYASIIVTKVIGNSMTKDIYIFENRYNNWVFIDKHNILIG